MKETEETGFWRLKANPICKAGVFDYLGSQIDLDGKMGLEKLRKYKVYRPAIELFDRDAIESFEGKPFVVGHKLLGDDEDCVPVEKVPAHGTIIHVRESSDQPGILIADILIYTATMKHLIEGGTKGLSLGYLCDFVPEAGTYDGQAYEFVQKGLRGNHLALVNKPRNGTYVQDSADGGDPSYGGDCLVYAIDSDVGKIACACSAFAIDSAIEEETKPMKTEKTEKQKTPEETLAELLTGKDTDACKATVGFLKDYLEKREQAKSGKTKTPTTDNGGTPTPPPKGDEGKDGGTGGTPPTGKTDKTDGGTPPAGDGNTPPAGDGNASTDGGTGDGNTPPEKKDGQTPTGDCGGTGCGEGEPPKTPKTPTGDGADGGTPPATKTDGGDNGAIPKGDDAATPKGDEKKENVFTDPKTGKAFLGDEAIRKEFFRQFSKASDLKNRVSHLVGAFDSAEMTEAEIAAYSCRKLGIAFDEAIPETAVYAINARLSAAPGEGGSVAAPAKTPTFDSADNAKTVESDTQKCVAAYFGDNQ